VAGASFARFFGVAWTGLAIATTEVQSCAAGSQAIVNAVCRAFLLV